MSFFLGSRGNEAIVNVTLIRFQLRKPQQKNRHIATIRERFRSALSGHEGDDLGSDQFRRRRDLHAINPFHGRKKLNGADVDQVTISFLLHLEKPESFSSRHLPNTFRNVELKAEVFLELFRKIAGACGEDIHILRHARFADIGIDGLRPKQGGMIQAAQKI